MSYVDLMANDRWTEAAHTNYTEAYVSARVPIARERILTRRMLSMILSLILPADHPMRALCVPLTQEQIAEAMAAAQVFAQAEELGDAARADMALLAQALAVEGGTLDPAGVAQAVTDLVAARAAARAAQNPISEPQP